MNVSSLLQSNQCARASHRPKFAQRQKSMELIANFGAMCSNAISLEMPNEHRGVRFARHPADAAPVLKKLEFLRNSLDLRPHCR